MQRIIETFIEFFESDDGVTAMEYALLGGLISVVIVFAVASVGTTLNGFFTYVASQVAAAVNGL